jgi:bifunctional UDP-N-acetylglucosamine pyrophosphorylase/glucosamine-1-phosphate N-acetyltransferase
MNLSIVILAAGNGKRMYSAVPKILHPLGGVPLLARVVATAQSLNPHSIFIVYGGDRGQVRETLGNMPVISWVEQSEPRGTGHALLQAMPLIENDHRILVLYGDVPLISTATLQLLLKTVSTDNLGLLVTELDDPTGFGRIIRDEQKCITAIIEHKDATPEQLCIKEINTGILTASASALKRWLPQLQNKNTQGEYYLTDIVTMAVAENTQVIGTPVTCAKEVRGVNDRKELMELERFYQQHVAEQLLKQGVTFYDSMRFDCRGELHASEDVIIDVNVIIEGKVSIASGSVIGANTVLKNVTIGKNVIIKPHCVIDGAVIGDNCVVGPFAHIRPQTYLDEQVHIGNFVELKNTKIGSDSKANHLSYLGDAEIGVSVNVGAGTITCNYDGAVKNHTIIEDDAFIGSGTELVAPVVIGQGAYIGAGSTITKDAPKHALTIARARQTTVNGWKNNKNKTS